MIYIQELINLSKKLMSAMKLTRKANEDLFNQYNAKSTECWKAGDNDGSTYWNDRAYAILCENEKIDKDIRKLKQEVSQYAY